MSLQLVAFGEEQFNRIFPFYLKLDASLRIASMGRSISKVLSQGVGSDFLDQFNLIHPRLKTVDFHSIKGIGNQIVLLNLKRDTKTIFRGQMEFLADSNEIMFIGTPWVLSIDDLKDKNLTLNDFAKHDALIDQLNILKAQELATGDIRRMLAVANEQKNAIKNSEHLWKFALEGNGDGIWQHDLSGTDSLFFPPFKKALGYPIDEEFGYNEWHEALYPGDFEKINETFEQYLKGDSRQFIIEHRLKHKNGDYKYFVARGIVVDWDERGLPRMVIGTITDIDQQKQLELQIKETANRLTYLIENLHSGVIVENKERQIILVNEQFCKIFGIRVTPQQLIGKDFTGIIEAGRNLFKKPAEFTERVYKILEQKNVALHETLELKDGRYLERNYVPIFLDGNYEGHLWNFEDVTDKIIAEKRLDKQRRFYENVLNNIPEDIVTFSPDHEYLYINPTAIKEPELRKWMIGKRDEDYCIYKNKPLTIAQERREKFNIVLNTKRLHFWEEKVVAPDGTAEYFLRNLYPVLDEHNEVQQVISFSVNISDRKKIEDQLQINEKRYRDLFNYSQAYICTHDLKGKLLTANPALCEKLGLSQDEVLGRYITEFIPKNDLRNFETEYIQRVIDTGSAKGVFRVLGKTDKKSFLLYQNFKVEEESSEPYIISFSQDITERIWVEKELRKAKQITEESSKAKELFLANMSHEIRTPMSGILGIANLLSKTELGEQQRRYTSLITASANSLLAIVNDVLDIEKIASGKFELEHIPFKLEEKVNTTVQSFQFKAEEKNIHLTFKSNVAEDLIVLGDPSRLGQILNNLISNALKFTSKGDIYVSISYARHEYKSVVIEFEVRDTGLGIKQEKLADIFKPFVQASSDTSRKFGGTGLGLSICKELIDLQGGKITVESELNVGTCFTFYLPYDKGDASMLLKDHGEIDYKSLGKLNVLVAEDYELNQFLIKHVLDDWGCKATIVNNGLEAVEEVARNDFDLILMDIHMPEMDGIAATRKIREMADPKKSSVPIIALTANALRGDHLNYMQAGMNECVTKPYTEEKLFRMIVKIIQPKIGNPTVVEEVEEKAAVPKVPDTYIEQSDKLYDLAFINEFAKGDSSFVKKMVSIFVDTMNTELVHLEKAGEEKQFEKISKIAHKMKSAIDGLGINSLKQTIRQLETTDYKSGANGDPVDVINHIKSVLEEAFLQLKDIVYVEVVK